MANTISMGYSAADVVGLTMYAKKNIEIKASAFDNSQVLWTVNAGEIIGVVHSYLAPTSGRSTLYWMFEDAYGVPFYVAHKKGLIDIKNLEEQGLLSIEDILDAQKPLADKIIGGILSLGTTLIVGRLIIEYIKDNE